MSAHEKAAGATLTRETILRGLQSLSDELGKRGVTGEACLFGGTVMVLAFSARVPYDDLTPFAHALVAAAPQQLVFGTDWPHVMMEGEMPNTGTLVEQLAVWAPEAATRTRILVNNPARLYRF